MKKLVKVTQNHIKNGKCCVADSCPVALAIRNKLGVTADVWPDYMEIINAAGRALHIAPSRSVTRFIRRFDNGKPVKPFNFYLNVD